MTPTIATNVKINTRRSDSTRITGFLVCLLGVGSGVDGAGKEPLSGGGGGITGFSLMAGIVYSKGGGGGTASVGGKLSDFFCHSYTVGGRGAESARDTFSLSSLRPRI